MTVRQRNDLNYVQVVQSRVTVAVGVISSVVIAAQNLRGFDQAVVFIDNDGSDVFTGRLEISPDGTFPGVTLPDDSFADMAAGASYWSRVPGAAQYLRVTGSFATTPGNIRVSLILIRFASRES